MKKKTLTILDNIVIEDYYYMTTMNEHMNRMKLTQYEPKMVYSNVVKSNEPLCLGLKA